MQNQSHWAKSQGTGRAVFFLEALAENRAPHLWQAYSLARGSFLHLQSYLKIFRPLPDSDSLASIFHF